MDYHLYFCFLSMKENKVKRYEKVGKSCINTEIYNIFTILVDIDKQVTFM